MNQLHIDARCAVPSMLHFRCPRAQCNGGRGKPNWARIECKLAKQEFRQPDLRWGQDAVQPPTESPSQEAQLQQQTSSQRATAMMHGIASGAASSWQGAACPPIHEHRPWASPAMQEEVILPNPGYRVPANLWNFNIMERALNPGPMASFLRHVSAMENPNNPSYLWWSSAS